MSVLITNLASSVLASSVSGGATSLSVTTGEGSKFPTISSSLDFFYVRLGTDESNEIVKVTARSGDTLTCAGTVGAWSTGTPIALTICKEIFDAIPRIINSDTTITVKSSGGDFTTISAALDALAGVFISGTATVTVEVDDGTWTITTNLTDAQLSSDRIRVVGKNTYSKSVTSIQSSSGSAGAYSVVVNVDNTTSAAAGDYAIVLSASGGTTPLHLCGCHEITSVDSGNSRLTLSSKNLVGVPAGAVTATLIVVKTVIAMSGCHGFSLTGKGLNRIDKLVVKGVGGSTYNGINANMSRAIGLSTASAAFGIVNCAYGIAGFNGTIAFLRYFAVSGCVSGIYLTNKVAGDFINSAITGCTTGVTSAVSAASILQNAIVTGNTTGFNSNGMSYTLSTAANVTGNTTNYSPTANSVGNDNAYNDN